MHRFLGGRKTVRQDEVSRVLPRIESPYLDGDAAETGYYPAPARAAAAPIANSNETQTGLQGYPVPTSVPMSSNAAPKFSYISQFELPKIKNLPLANVNNSAFQKIMAAPASCTGLLISKDVHLQQSTSIGTAVLISNNQALVARHCKEHAGLPVVHSSPISQQAAARGNNSARGDNSINAAATAAVNATGVGIENKRGDDNSRRGTAEATGNGNTIVNINQSKTCVML